MGYRSTVAYTIRFTPTAEGNNSPTDEELKQCKASFYVFLAEAKVSYLGALEDECMRVDESNMALNFLAENVKWYESYPEVQVHEDLISLAKEWAEETYVPSHSGNRNIGGIFMRIGEEVEDIVQDAWGEHDWDWIQLHRTIVSDWME